MASAASFLIFLYASIAKAIKEIGEKYNAAPTTPSISAECSAISGALIDIQLLLSQPHALSSRVISQTQLEEVLKNVYMRCNITLSRLEEEVGKCVGNPTATGEGYRTWNRTQLCDEVLIKGLLQQTQKQLSDISLLMAAAQRNSSSEIQQLLKNNIFIDDLVNRKDQTDVLPTSQLCGYNQSLRKQSDADSKSICTHTSGDASCFSFGSAQSEPYHELDGEIATVTPKSQSQSAPPQSGEIKKAPRAQPGSIFFKLFTSKTELHRAAKKGDVLKIKALIDLGVDINYEGSSGCTALHLATDCGHEAVVRLLLDNGADPMATSSEGRTPLHSAARTGNPAVVRLLLKKVVNVHAKDPSGSTPLHVAAYNGQESVVRILLEKYPLVEVTGPSGFTALHVAAYNGQSAVVRLLVEMGADLEARSDSGRTALQLAAEKGHEAVVRHLLQHGANVMAKDSHGRTALQGAVSNQHGIVAQLLLDKAVLPVAPSPWQPPRDSGSEATYELSAVEPDVKMPERDATETSAWSLQSLKAPMYKSFASQDVVELPAVELNAGLRSLRLIDQQPTLLSRQRRTWRP